VTVRIGHAGLGYWGPNLARNFGELAELRWLCDLSPDLLSEHAGRYPDARTTTDFEDLLFDPELDAVSIATPVVTHYDLAKRALLAGKHVFVEKPPAQSSTEAEELVALAEERGLAFMPGYLLLYHPAVSRLKELIETGELGDVLYLYGNRQNLGQIRRDENALWSLGAHDLSVLLYLVGEEPVEAWARGESFLREGVEDVVFCYLRFPTGLAAHLHLSWLDPHKERRFTVVGSRKMATFDDMELERKLTVYDKGFDEDFASYGEYIARSGDVWSPRVGNDEPLRIECRHFADCARDGVAPRSDGESGLRVVRVLESLQRSLDERRRAQAV
jgi:predicted dehydrogenase